MHMDSGRHGDDSGHTGSQYLPCMVASSSEVASVLVQGAAAQRSIPILRGAPAGMTCLFESS